MFDDLLDRVVARLMAAAGLIMASAIAAVAGAMAFYAFLSPIIGPAWAYAVLAVVASLVVAVWAILQRQQRSKAKTPSLDERISTLIERHPGVAFVIGLAAGALLKGDPHKALSIWSRRPRR